MERPPESSVSTFYVAFTVPHNMIIRYRVDGEEKATDIVHRFVAWLRSGRRRPTKTFLVTTCKPKSVVLDENGAGTKPVFSSVLDASTAIEAVILKRKQQVR